MLSSVANCVQILGEGILRFDSFTHDQLTRPEPHPAKLRVKSPKGRSGGGGSIHLLLSYIANPPRLSSSQQAQPPPSTSQPNEAKEQKTSRKNLETLDEEDEEGGEEGGSDSDEGGDARSRRSGHSGGGGSRANGRERNDRSMAASVSSRGYDNESHSEGGYSKRNELAALTAVRQLVLLCCALFTLQSSQYFCTC